MKRLLAISSVLLAAAVVLTLGTGAGGGDGGSYEVRAIFDNAVSAIPGEDVKIAGVKVGKISGLEVTKDQKAAMTLRIDDPAFRDFRSDAECTIRPQSLIGEKFVECTPTQPRAPGAPEPPPLARIERGPGKGQHLVPLTQTHTPVDIDLINNILRRPYSERLTIILGELGTAVAGRGSDLNQVIRRANPALQQTDRVLSMLASQNRVLANLARDSDTVLAPLARDRRRVADSIVQSNAVAQATAERGTALERNLQLLPPFLQQLRPTVQRLGALSDQAAPVFEDLGAQAPSISAFIQQLGPFSEASIPALRTLGRASDYGIPAMVALRPTAVDLQTFAARARPVGANLAALTTSLRDTGGIERLMDYIFYQVAAVNGFDQFGHYLRAALIVNLCSTYSTQPVTGCSANFSSSASSSSTRKRASAGGSSLNRVASAPRGRRSPTIQLPGATGEAAPGAGPPSPTAPAAPAGGSGGTPAPAQSGTPSGDPTTGLLNYLLGSDGR